MKIVRNSVIPFEGFKAVTIFPFIFVREGAEFTVEDYNHEQIHGRQQVEMLIIPFFLWYLVEWIIKLFVGQGNAYRRISFEREAHQNEKYPLYLDDRKFYAWFKYLFNS